MNEQESGAQFAARLHLQTVETQARIIRGQQKEIDRLKERLADTELLDAVQAIIGEINYMDARWLQDAAQFGVRAAIRKALTAHSVMVWPEGFAPDPMAEAGSDIKRDAGQASNRAEPWSDAERERFRQTLSTGDRCKVCTVLMGGQHFAGCSQEGAQPIECPICHDTGTAFGKACTCRVGHAIGQMHQSTGMRCPICCARKGEPHTPECTETGLA